MAKRRHNSTGRPAGPGSTPEPATQSASTSTPPGSSAARAKARRATARSQPGHPLRRWAIPGLLGAAALITVGVLAFGGAATASDPSGGSASVRAVLGQAEAPVLIQEYGDFQCPSCGAFARLIEPQIRAAYIDTGKVRLEWHDFAWIGAESRDAANAARCAGDQGKFWEYHDLLYQSQKGENQGAFSKDRLKSFGAGLGLGAATFGACIDGGSHLGAVQTDFADVSSKGFNGTPTFVIGTQRIVGAQPFEVFQAAIEAALATK